MKLPSVCYLLKDNFCFIQCIVLIMPLSIMNFYFVTSQCRAPEIDMKELENLFSAAVPNSDRGGKSSQRGPRGPKVDKVQLVIQLLMLTNI